MTELAVAPTDAGTFANLACPTVIESNATVALSLPKCRADAASLEPTMNRTSVPTIDATAALVPMRTATLAIVSPLGVPMIGAGPPSLPPESGFPDSHAALFLSVVVSGGGGIVSRPRQSP